MFARASYRCRYLRYAEQAARAARPSLPSRGHADRRRSRCRPAPAGKDRASPIRAPLQARARALRRAISCGRGRAGRGCRSESADLRRCPATTTRTRQGSLASVTSTSIVRGETTAASGVTTPYDCAHSVAHFALRDQPLSVRLVLRPALVQTAQDRRRGHGCGRRTGIVERRPSMQHRKVRQSHGVARGDHIAPVRPYRMDTARASELASSLSMISGPRS